MKRIVPLLLALSLPSMALADLEATYKVGGNQSTMTVDYQDAHHLRMSTPGSAYMLVTGDKIYTVVNRNGQLMAMDVQKMGEMMEKYRKQTHQAQPKAKPMSFSLKNTGRTEKVAGYSGKVHTMEVNGKTVTVVLTDDKDVARLTEGFMGAMLKMGQSLSDDQTMDPKKILGEIRKTGYGGLLKQGNDFVLMSLHKVDKPDSFYTLPKNAHVVDIPTTPPGAGTQ
ncbi:hypothetical protein [Mangrovitalea sediminis]|uniref:hypothetical protein n=1 Tax=Mangrovitalea sediminis TaxID=1982043 RepID=UPI000BE51BBA|nr:hypothetical protein [Mangrovitalea sediminis]